MISWAMCITFFLLISSCCCRQEKTENTSCNQRRDLCQTLPDHLQARCRSPWSTLLLSKSTHDNIHRAAAPKMSSPPVFLLMCVVMGRLLNGLIRTVAAPLPSSPDWNVLLVKAVPTCMWGADSIVTGSQRTKEEKKGSYSWTCNHSALAQPLPKLHPLLKAAKGDKHACQRTRAWSPGAAVTCRSAAEIRG